MRIKRQRASQLLLGFARHQTTGRQHHQLGQVGIIAGHNIGRLEFNIFSFGLIGPDKIAQTCFVAGQQRLPLGVGRPFFGGFAQTLYQFGIAILGSWQIIRDGLRFHFGLTGTVFGALLRQLQPQVQPQIAIARRAQLHIQHKGAAD